MGVSPVSLLLLTEWVISHSGCLLCCSSYPPLNCQCVTLCLLLKRRMAGASQTLRQCRRKQSSPCRACATLRCHCRGFRGGLLHQTHVPSCSPVPPATLRASRKEHPVAGGVPPRKQSQEEIYTHKYGELATWVWGSLSRSEAHGAGKQEGKITGSPKPLGPRRSCWPSPSSSQGRPKPSLKGLPTD